jgi:imidazole glycerol-phosphate synthase subunit HisH
MARLQQKMAASRVVLVLDYGAGNLRSVANAISRLGYQARVSDSVQDLKSARILIFPGQGAAAQVMGSLKRREMMQPIREYIEQGRPFLGVCMGLQVLFSSSEEDNNCECLGIIPGRVRKLPPGLKTPHMGWNQVRQVRKHPVFDGIPDNTNFYFVHSYYADPDDRSVVIGEADYGVSVCAAVARGNLVATQFHPEKSGEPGLRMYDNFIKQAMQ